MWKKPGRAGSDPGRSEFGVGVLVHIAESDDGDGDGSEWTGEPTGLIVSTGPSTLAPGAGPGDAGPAWVVEFTEPQFRRDGRGPFSRAQVSQSRLVVAEPFHDGEAEFASRDDE